MALKVGIDLGTTFSAVAMIDPVTGRPVIIPNSSGEYVTPSVLCFKQNDESDDEEDNIEILFGSPAKQEQAEGNPNSVAFFKRCMGNDNYEVEIFDEAYNAEDMSAVFLKCLKDDAETVLGEEITDAVITVPAYFAHKERTATLSAGKRAGLNVLSIINEPSAAAFAYGLTEKEQPQTVLIYDLGGGTFDVTAARIDKKQINILGSDGDHELGGKDWDDAVAKYIASEFEDITGEDLTLDGQAVAMLLVIAENIKKELSTADQAVVSLNYGEEEVSIEITYDTFREVTEFLTRKTKDVTERMLESVNLTWDEFDGVILVGGSTRMRMIREFVTQMSSKKPLDGVNVDDAVSLGAAIRANINDDGKFAYERGEEVVRVQGAKAISDVTAHSLGMIAQSADGERYENSVIIEKNTKIPAEATRPFKIKTRAAEYGTNELEIYLTQGEFERPLDNVIINKYVVKGIEYVDAPESVISVTYKYNSNGVIEVSAVQNETGKHLDIVVRSVPEDMEWTDEKDIFAGPKTGQSSRNGGRPRHMEAILCVDLSGSMAGEPTRVAQEAMRTFCSQVLEDTLPAKIGIVAFADDVEILTTPENNTKILYDKIDMLRYTNVGAGNLADPFEAARAIFLGADAQYIVILTDGVWSDPKRAIAFAKDCKKSGIHVIALGIGDADEKFTDSLSTINIENFSSFTDLANLASSFSKIARAITSDE